MKKTDYKIEEVVSKKESFVIDSQTGEVLDKIVDYDKDKVVRGADGDFTLLFPQVLSAFRRLGKIDIIALSYLALEAGYNTNMVSITNLQYQQMSTVTGYQEGSLRNSVGKLKKRMLLISYGSGQYLVHPYFSWRGKKSERRRCVERLQKEGNNRLKQKAAK